ncbi:MAG: type III-B CRISPR module RAMP protein Cmr6 [Methanothermobacter tenebrarum]|nr:type III-B CRISPR module RAMP protein Cmr6 [Methanobacteriaceae archaeon]
MFLLPKKQSKMAEKLIDKQMKNHAPLNIGLIFDKYPTGEKKKSDKYPKVKGLKSHIMLKKKNKLSLPSSLIDKNLYKSFKKRREALLDALEEQKHNIERFQLELKWRLAINLGAASVYETSLLFHRNLSIPYIPGTALKGATRHYYALSKKSVEKLEDEIFGNQEQKGKVIFFDALPILDYDRDLITLDIMNVHYRDYYQGNLLSESTSPNPIFFLAIEKGTKFSFALASENEKMVKSTKKLLVEALKIHGIGAKTSVGYGYFKVIH